MEDRNIGINLLQKQYWLRAMTNGSSGSVLVNSDKGSNTYYEDSMLYAGIKQSEFMKEYEPTSHKIMSSDFYPDILKFDKDGVPFYEKITRVPFAFQQIILTKQLTALCGNPTRFRVPNAKLNSKVEETFAEWKEGWAVKDMDILIYEAFESIGKTGDVAVYMYMDENGALRHSVFSYAKGDILYPHYNKYGDIELLARRYSGLNSDGELSVMIDVFTDTKKYTLEVDTKDTQRKLTFCSGKYKIEGFRPASEPFVHGIGFCPVGYYKDPKGAWWTPSQKTIEEYEWNFSCLAHSNQAFAFPIMYIKGSKVKIEADMIRNSVKAIMLPKEGDAGFLNRPDGSASFDMQLKKLYDMIYQQSFAVNPPEVRSGDLPGVAIKLLYSPSIEKASEMAKKLNPFLDVIVSMFTHLYGLEKSKLKEFKELNVYAYQEPYVHQNDTEVMTNLEKGVQGGFVSRKTATEISPYSNNNEVDRLTQQEEDLKEEDLLLDLKVGEYDNKQAKGDSNKEE